MLRSGVRLGAATFLVGLSLAGPYAVCVAGADTGDDSGTVSAGPVSPAASAAAPRGGRSSAKGIAAQESRPGRSVARADSAPGVAGRARTVLEPSAAASSARTRVPSLVRESAITPLAPSAAVAMVSASTVSASTSNPFASTQAAVVPRPTAAVRANPLAHATAAPPAIIGQPAAAAKAFTPIQTIGSAFQQFLTNTANWLSTLPTGPITNAMEGAVWLVRRTLFPASVGVVTAPIEVPLYFTKINDSDATKLGIYATIGSGGTPQIFEFDTGGSGLYAAYASNYPSNSQWWGSGVNATSDPVSVQYDSGMSYTGVAATGQVSLFAAGGTAPLITSGRVSVGQMNNIEQVNPNTGEVTELWTPDGQAQAYPPIDKAFYGDFGVSPKYSPNGITNLIAQMTFARGLVPGFRVHVDPATKTAWMQIGLTKADLNDPSGNYFPMVLDPATPAGTSNPNSGLPYYSEQLFNADIEIADSGTTVVSTPNVGITPDTGAQTTLHNTNISPLPNPTNYAGITVGKEDGSQRLETGLRFRMYGTTTAGTRTKILDFQTNESANDGGVSVQNRTGNPVYYLNTGMFLFDEYDVVYSLGDGTVGLISNG